MEQPNKKDDQVVPEMYVSPFDRYYPAASARLAEFFSEEDKHKAFTDLADYLEKARSAEIYFFMQAIQIEAAEKPEAAALMEACSKVLRGRSADWDSDTEESTEN